MKNGKEKSTKASSWDIAGSIASIIAAIIAMLNWLGIKP